MAGHMARLPGKVESIINVADQPFQLESVVLLSTTNE
jgi:hypothetical protein